MKPTINSPTEYINTVPKERKPYFTKLRNTILKHLPEGFEETISYGMIGYVVPHDLYPAGYHCTPSLPLPFVSIANQKNHIALYHCGIYADDTIMQWFIEEYPKHCTYKLDMGKSCIRFKKPDAIPYELIGLLIGKISVDDYIHLYERQLK
ncbi:DUF1801 domain-containing protein [Echinicola strongylocentroti]|uniref:DUF1801 domain-containing protein n=1 Tax=Echinicola strongylocentroti TaxID=1795355 RepID=A0A2Z4INF2_9BACT|nr:DUF1801 domain-containing protein [Echinicola strongylocentroti]AWW32612.1 DUF1801 domain-containing protein [Echinicola strongylocentroti]